MLGKILLTLAVIIGAFLVLRQRHLAESEATRHKQKPVPRPPPAAADDVSLADDLRVGAYLFLALMVGTGAALYYYRWQDDHTVLTVNLHRAEQADPVTYQVYKYQMGARSFTTIDGTTVTVASSERMEVIGLQ